MYAPRPVILDVLSHHLTAPAEQGMPVTDQPQMNPGLLIPEVDNSEAQPQLEQHHQIQGQSQIQNHDS